MSIKLQATREDVIDFRAWLQDKTGTYNVQNPYNCAIAEYLRHKFPQAHVRFCGTSTVHINNRSFEVPAVIRKIAYERDTPPHFVRVMEYRAAYERATKAVQDFT
jgi:hypothetical protein